MGVTFFFNQGAVVIVAHKITDYFKCDQSVYLCLHDTDGIQTITIWDKKDWFYVYFLALKGNFYCPIT